VVSLAVHLADLVLDLPGSLLEPFDVTALSGDRLDLLGHPLGLRPELVGLLDGLAAPRHEVLQPGQVQGVATARQTADGIGTHVQQGARVMHGGPLPRRERFVRERAGASFAHKLARPAVSVGIDTACAARMRRQDGHHIRHPRRARITGLG
jgi:hypothetical protein